MSKQNLTKKEIRGAIWQKRAIRNPNAATRKRLASMEAAGEIKLERYDAHVGCMDDRLEWYSFTPRLQFGGGSSRKASEPVLVRGHDMRNVLRMDGRLGDTDVTLHFRDGSSVTLTSYPGEGLYQRCATFLQIAREG